VVKSNQGCDYPCWLPRGLTSSEGYKAFPTKLRTRRVSGQGRWAVGLSGIQDADPNIRTGLAKNCRHWKARPKVRVLRMKELESERMTPQDGPRCAILQAWAIQKDSQG
jgi:hypothetical protein